jgi:hypothetical protein
MLDQDKDSSSPSKLTHLPTKVGVNLTTDVVEEQKTTTSLDRALAVFWSPQ